MKRIIPILPWLGALLLIAIVLLSFESDLLWKIQQYNVFSDTPLFFREQMVVSGGLLSYVSCYFTQFFFHPWLGVLMLCGWWWLLMWLTKHTFRLSGNWPVLALIPVAILLIADMTLGYWHYFMKLRGYFFVPTIGTTVAVAMLWAFRALPQKLWIRIVCIILAAAIGYPLFGIYGLAAVVLMGIWTWRLSDKRNQNLILSVVALLSILAVPLFCYRYVYYQTYISDIWTTALPAFLIIDSYPIYFTPYILLGVFFLLMVLFFEKSLSGKWQKPLYRWSLQGVLALALIAVTWHYWYKDANFHHELVMNHCLEQTDWEGVIQEGKKQGDLEPTRPLVMMYNLALSRLGRQPDEMYNFPRGNKKPDTPIPVNMLYHVYGPIIYYHYGLLNDCHRLCMEYGVEMGWRMEYQEYMARCFVLSGEMQAAQKIVDNLRHTQFHSKWAESMQELIDNPKLISQVRETGPVTRMMHYDYSLGGDNGNLERYIMSLLAREDADDIYFQEQAVLGALWMMDSQLFFARFAHYTRLLPQGGHMPRLFQEAFYMFGKMSNTPNIERYPFDKGVKESYKSFMAEGKKYDGQSADIGRAALYPFFGNTYYYEYYFMKHLH